jgi:plastocyanin
MCGDLLWVERVVALTGEHRGDAIAPGLVFSPATIAAHVGDEVEWTNEDFVVHTATARHGEWDINLPPHATGDVELKKPGKIEYYCRFHPNMKGEIAIAPQ